MCKYLENSAIANETHESMEAVITALKPFNLTTAEVYQILNHLPSTKVEIYLVWKQFTVLWISYLLNYNVLLTNKHKDCGQLRKQTAARACGESTQHHCLLFQGGLNARCPRSPKLRLRNAICHWELNIPFALEELAVIPFLALLPSYLVELSSCKQEGNRKL